LSFERLSIVWICFPDAADTGKTHDRVAPPSTWTVQQPHWATPHPNLVPVMPSSSRMTQSSGMSGVPGRLNQTKALVLANR
jgi:hypothetical protein